MKSAFDVVAENARLHRERQAAKEISWCWDLLMAAILVVAVLAARNGW